MFGGPFHMGAVFAEFWAPARFGMGTISDMVNQHILQLDPSRRSVEVRDLVRPVTGRFDVFCWCIDLM